MSCLSHVVTRLLAAEQCKLQPGLHLRGDHGPQHLAGPGPSAPGAEESKPRTPNPHRGDMSAALPLLESHQSNVQTRHHRGASASGSISALSPQPAGDRNTEPSSLPGRRGSWQRLSISGHLGCGLGPGVSGDVGGPLLLCLEPTCPLRPDLGAAWASHPLPMMLCEHRSQCEAQERNFSGCPDTVPSEKQTGPSSQGVA